MTTPPQGSSPEWYKDAALFKAALAKHGKSNTKAAEATNLSEFTIRKRRKRHGIDASPARGQATPQRGTWPTADEVEIDADHLDDIEKLLAERGMKLADWVIVRVTANKWEGMAKNDA